MTTKHSISIAVVEASAQTRQVLVDMLAAEHDINVNTAANSMGSIVEMVADGTLDVVVIAGEANDGATKDNIRNLMAYRPIPIIMMSDLTPRDADLALDALELGVFDFIERPDNAAGSVRNVAIQYELCKKVRAAAKARISGRVKSDRQIRPLMFRVKREGVPIIAVGAATGGVSALEHLLQRFPSICPPVLIVQHTPPSFVRPLAARLNKQSQMTVTEAADGAPLQNGYAYLAPAGKHLTVRKQGGQFVCQLDNEAALRGYRPSIDKLFSSVAQHVGSEAIGVLLTGMGDDGALGLLAMREQGAHTIVQDEKSAVVYDGMPRAAMDVNAASVQLSLTGIPRRVIDICNQRISA